MFFESRNLLALTGLQDRQDLHDPVNHEGLVNPVETDLYSGIFASLWANAYTTSSRRSETPSFE
jgi:hypothetical protein